MKDYRYWHSIKTSIENEYFEKEFKEGDVWWCSLGLNIGYEQDGKNNDFKRPILIIKKFHKGILWALPLTSKIKNNVFHFKLQNRESSVILSQLRVTSSKRLLRRIFHLNNVEVLQIKKKIIDLLCENKTDPFGSSGA